MMHTCQAWDYETMCGKPARFTVEFSHDPFDDAKDHTERIPVLVLLNVDTDYWDLPEMDGQRHKIWLCAEHYDQWMAAK